MMENSIHDSESASDVAAPFVADAAELVVASGNLPDTARNNNFPETLRRQTLQGIPPIQLARMFIEQGMRHSGEMRRLTGERNEVGLVLVQTQEELTGAYQENDKIRELALQHIEAQNKTIREREIEIADLKVQLESQQNLVERVMAYMYGIGVLAGRRAVLAELSDLRDQRRINETPAWQRWMLDHFYAEKRPKNVKAKSVKPAGYGRLMWSDRIGTAVTATAQVWRKNIINCFGLRKSD